jgi:hypothetical protein
VRRDLLGEARENLRAAQEQLARLQSLTTDLSDRLMAGSGSRAVAAHYDDDGVLLSLEIDDDRRRELTQEQLIDQIDFALASGPVPHRHPAAEDVVSRAEAPFAADASHAPRAAATDEFSAASGALTLVTVGGKPVRIRTRPGWILSEPSKSLSSTLVALARRAASHFDRR